MIITFRDDGTGYLPTSREAAKWRMILKQLRQEWQKTLPTQTELDCFYGWLGSEWKIKVIYDNANMAGYISGIDVDDSSYTMLLIRFSK